MKPILKQLFPLFLLVTIISTSPQSYNNNDARIPPQPSFLVKCCDHLMCDTRAEFCDRITTTNPQKCDCLSCRAYEKLATSDVRYRNTFRTSCQTYVRHKEAINEALLEHSNSELNVRKKLREFSNYQQHQMKNQPNYPPMGGGGGGQNQRILQPQNSPPLQEDIEANWTLSEKNLLLFLTKFHLFMTGVVIALIVFLVGSKVKRIRRSRRSCKVKWDGSTPMYNPANGMPPSSYEWSSNPKKLKDLEMDYDAPVNYKSEYKMSKLKKIDNDLPPNGSVMMKSSWKPSAPCKAMPPSPAPLPAPGTLGIGKSNKTSNKLNGVVSHNNSKSHHSKLHLDVPQKRRHNHYTDPQKQPHVSSTSGFNNTMSVSASRNTPTGTLSRNHMPPPLVSSVGDVGQLSSFTEASSNYSDNNAPSSITEPSLSLSPGESDDMRLLAEIQRGTALHPNSVNFSPGIISSPKHDNIHHHDNIHQLQPSRFNFDDAAITSYT